MSAFGVRSRLLLQSQKKAEATYRRGDLFDKRRKLMEAWAVPCAADNNSINSRGAALCATGRKRGSSRYLLPMAATLWLGHSPDFFERVFPQQHLKLPYEKRDRALDTEGVAEKILSAKRELTPGNIDQLMRALD